MSDTLKTDQDQSDVHAHTHANAISLPKQDLSDSDEHEMSFQSLFQDEDDDTFLAPTPRRRRFWLIVVSIVLLIGVVGGGIFVYMLRTSTAPVQYTTAAVSVGNITNTVSASGPLQAKAEYDLNFTQAGRIQAINVQVGQQVKAGQLLAELNAPNLPIAVAQAQLAVTNAQTTYNTAVADGFAAATISADSVQLQLAQLQLQTAQNNLAAAVITAPSSGVIAAINGVVGQSAGGSGSGSGSSNASSASSALIVLLDTSGFTITASVNEADIAKVQLNQPMQFTISSYPSQTFNGTVSSIGIIGTTSSGVVSYPVTLAVNMSSVGTTRILPGMTAAVSITTAQRIGALLVSNSAFTFTTTALQAGVINRSSLSALSQSIGGGKISTLSTGTRRVVLVMRNNQLVPVLVTVGLSNGTFSEVLSGLNQGDLVVVGATGGPFTNLSGGSNTTTGGTRNGGLGGGGFGGGGLNGGNGGGVRSGSGG